jgi:hypothetical protein
VGNKNKGPKSLVPIDSTKTPKSQYQANWQEMYPSWRVSLLEVVDPFGWHSSGVADLHKVRQRFANFESMTWKQILNEGNYRNHFIARDKLCNEAQERLRVLGQDDVDAVMSLGVTQRARVFGIMEHNIFKVLWWDPQHLVCPVAKRNT